jgi:hypothetical protein
MTQPPDVPPGPPRPPLETFRERYEEIRPQLEALIDASLERPLTEDETRQARYLVSWQAKLLHGWLYRVAPPPERQPPPVRPEMVRPEGGVPLRMVPRWTPTAGYRHRMRLQYAGKPEPEEGNDWTILHQRPGEDPLPPAFQFTLATIDPDARTLTFLYDMKCLGQYTDRPD